MVSSPETVKHMTGKYLSPVSGYVQTCLTAGGWIRPVIDHRVPDLLSRALWLKRPQCQPGSMSVRDLVPVPKFCHPWAEQALLVSSWPVLLGLLWNFYSWQQFFHWLHGLLLLFLTTRNVKTFLFLLQYNWKQPCLNWGEERIWFSLAFSFQLTFEKLYLSPRGYTTAVLWVDLLLLSVWQRDGSRVVLLHFFSSFAMLFLISVFQVWPSRASEALVICQKYTWKYIWYEVKKQIAMHFQKVLQAF